MKRIYIPTLTIFCLSFFLTSCHKSDNPTCVAGPNGSTALVVYSLHNGDTLVHSYQHADTLFVAWNDAGDPPNPLFYDKAYVASLGENHVHVHELKCGTYRLRLSVYDTVAARRYTGATITTITEGATEVPIGVVVN
jgi:hypothetical protein